MHSIPTSLPSLLTDPDYKSFFAKPLKPYRSLTPPWAIVAVSHDLRYGTITRASFKEAWQKASELLKRGDIMDVSIFAKNRITPTPAILDQRLTRPHEDWCGRCRRPSVFRVYRTSHPALRHAPVVIADTRRCFYCGISWEYLYG